MLTAGERVSRMSAAEQTAWREDQNELLIKLTGSEERAAGARNIASVVLEFGPKEFTDKLRASGALDDAGVIRNLALQGERMAYRGNLR